jgi:hypothetical protein
LVLSFSFSLLPESKYVAFDHFGETTMSTQYLSLRQKTETQNVGKE